MPVSVKIAGCISGIKDPTDHFHLVVSPCAESVHLSSGFFLSHAVKNVLGILTSIHLEKLTCALIGVSVWP